VDSSKPTEGITQREIARALGLSQSAVSHALAGTSKVSEATREKVLSYAKEHDYRADPALSALAAYRTGKRKPGFQGTVAWVTNFATAEGWRLPPFTDYYQGAIDYLAQNGYGLDTVWMGQPGLDANRLQQILKNRGIDALLLCPQERSGVELDLSFEDFSVVTFGFSLCKPVFHNVTAHGFASMRALCEELRLRGHRSIGLLYSRESEERSLGSWIGGIAAAHALDTDRLPVPPLICDDLSDKDLRAWYESYQPDAIISINPEPLERLRAFGLSIPEDVSVCLTVADHDKGFGGMDFDHQRIGAIAARKLIGLYHGRERGAPGQPEVTAIAGRFWPGQTVGMRAF